MTSPCPDALQPFLIAFVTPLDLRYCAEGFHSDEASRIVPENECTIIMDGPKA